MKSALDQRLNTNLVDLRIISMLIENVVKIEIMLLDILGKVNFISTKSKLDM
jgi:hypothetical protein